MATATLTPNEALTLARDRDVSLDELARRLGQSETFAAGLIHAVCGDDDFAFAAAQDGYHPTPAEMADYQDGFRRGCDLMERFRLADGWAECNATAAVEAAYAAEPLPVCCNDCPF